MHKSLTAAVAAALLLTACGDQTVLGPEPQFAKKPGGGGSTDGASFSYTAATLFEGVAMSLNDAGTVVGGRDGQAIVWQDGIETMIPLGAFSSGVARFINSAGTVVGLRSGGGGPPRQAFLYSNGVTAPLSAMMDDPSLAEPLQLGDLESEPYGMNDAGSVIGQGWFPMLMSDGTMGKARFGFVWTAGEASFLRGGIPAGINAVGAIVGNLWTRSLDLAPVRWDPPYADVPTTYQVLVDHFAAQGLREIPLSGINAAGHVIGRACDGALHASSPCVQATKHSAFILIGSRIITLPPLSGDHQAAPRAVTGVVNDRVRVTGTSLGSQVQRPVVWEIELASGLVEVAELPTRTVRGSAAGGSANGINGLFQVAGWSENSAVLWSPAQVDDGGGECKPHPKHPDRCQ